MPAEQALLGQRLVVLLRRVEHHLHDAVDVAVGTLEADDLEPQAPGHPRAHLVGVEPLALDLTARHDLVGNGTQHRVVADLGAKGFLLADQAPLFQSSSGERRGDLRLLPPTIGPAVPCVNFLGLMRRERWVL